MTMARQPWAACRPPRRSRRAPRLRSIVSETPSVCSCRTSPIRRRRRCRGAEDVLVEPVEVVLHDGAAGLRLRRTVADTFEALINNELRRHSDVLEAVIELVRIPRRHALLARA